MTESSLDRMVFQCVTWRESFERDVGKVVCLTGRHRHARDSLFQSVLDRVRWGRANAQTIEMINNTWVNTFSGPVIRMRIKRSVVQAINEAKLQTIDSPVRSFEAQDVFNTRDGREVEEALAALRSSVELSVTLKRSAAVILTRKVQGVQPGTRGLVVEFTCQAINIGKESQMVETVVCDFNGVIVEVGRTRFSVFDGTGREVAYCEQIPLILGWAVTVHRAQGLTLEAVEIDFEVDTWTTCGLVYTALSRVRSFSALRVKGLRRELIQSSSSAAAYFEKKLEEDGIDPTDDGRPPRDG